MRKAAHGGWSWSARCATAFFSRTVIMPPAKSTSEIRIRISSDRRAPYRRSWRSGGGSTGGRHGRGVGEQFFDLGLEKVQCVPEFGLALGGEARHLPLDLDSGLERRLGILSSRAPLP